MVIPVWVRGSHSRSARTLASPRSSSFTTPPRLRIRLAGLTSRWISLFSWACWRPEAAWRIDFAGRSNAKRRQSLLHPLGNEPVQGHSIDVFHHQVVDPIRLACIEGPHDVGMVQRTGGLHLPAEPGDGLRLVEVALGQHLDGHDLVQEDLPSPVDDPHATLAERLQKLVVPQPSGLQKAAEDRSRPARRSPGSGGGTAQAWRVSPAF